MNSRLTKMRGRLLLVILTAVMLATHSPASALEPDYDIDISINPAPHIINLNGCMDTFVIHTNMSYFQVNPLSVTVNEAPLLAWKMDDLGFFDAIVEVDAIGLTAGEFNLLELEGETFDGLIFYGAEELLIIDKAAGPGKIFK